MRGNTNTIPRTRALRNSKGINEPFKKVEGTNVKPLAIIEQAASKIAPGRAPLFIEAHLVMALMLIESEGPIGRMTLAKTLGLGEGTTRTLMRHLEKEGLIKSSRAGIVLTDSGKNLHSSLKSKIAERIGVKQSSLTIGPFNVAIIMKKAADAVKSGLEQRDAAIMIGAMGATTLIFNNGKLKMPPVNEDASRKAPAMCKALVSTLKPQEGDVIVIGSANNELTAELGAIAAAIETLTVASKAGKASSFDGV